MGRLKLCPIDEHGLSGIGSVVTNAACTASDASNFLRSCVQKVTKDTRLLEKIHRKRGGSFGYSRTQVL
jgi:hypothetical protein